MASFSRLTWQVSSALFYTILFLDMNYRKNIETVGSVGGVLQEEFDFIVVGAGSAGAAVAARLAETSATVLLIEAGGEQPYKATIPWFHLWLAGSPIDWSYETASGSGSGYEGGKSKWWRGKVAGGTSSINTMIYMRGNRKDYDGWSQDFGLTDWSWDKCLPYFKKLENMKNKEKRDSGLYGDDGPIVVEDSKHSTEVMDGFLEAGSLLGLQERDQNSGDTTEGVARLQWTISEGQRSSSLEYLTTHRKNLHITLRTQVLRIIFSGRTAVGLEVLRGKKIFQIKCSKEIILSAGTIGSPHILMLSGVGPKEHLAQHNIPVVAHLPGVGSNLHDHHATYGLTWQTQVGTAYNPFIYTANPLTLMQWKTSRTGPLAAPIGIEGNAFVRTKYAPENWPDIQIAFVSSHPGFDGGTVYKDFLGISEKVYQEYFSELSQSEGYSLYPILSRPNSRGSVRLKSGNPIEYPEITLDYLADGQDIAALVEGIKIAFQIGNSSAFSKYGSRFHDQPFPQCIHMEMYTDAYWECFVRSMTTTDHHPVGTCRMGLREKVDTVVDSRLRVVGVKNLRVVDGSVLPRIPSGNINIPIIMVAEKAVDAIKEDHNLI